MCRCEHTTICEIDAPKELNDRLRMEARRKDKEFRPMSRQSVSEAKRLNRGLAAMSYGTNR